MVFYRFIFLFICRAFLDIFVQLVEDLYDLPTRTRVLSSQEKPYDFVIGILILSLTLAGCGSGSGKDKEAPQQNVGRFSDQAFVNIRLPSVARFGFSVALWGDTLVVGVPNDSSRARGVFTEADEDTVTDGGSGSSGAVWVFTRSGGVWTRQAYIKASHLESGDLFGTSVALWQDTLAVGVPGDDSGSTGVGGDLTNSSASQSGAVYIFTRSNGTWAQKDYIKASNTERDDGFGTSVVLWGNILAVGAPREDSSATGIGENQNENSSSDSGAVYIYKRVGGNWSQEAYIKASNTGGGELFGSNLALHEEMLAVVAEREDSGATGINGDQTDESAPGSGGVYIFTRGAGNWGQEAYIKASNSQAGDRFGAGLALGNDLLVVGAPGEDSRATRFDGLQTDETEPESGAAYLFTRNGGIWSQALYIKASDSDVEDQFGESVALWDDTFVVGAPFADGGGAVYPFTRSNGSWRQEDKIKRDPSAEPPLNQSGARFGDNVAAWDDTLAVADPLPVKSNGTLFNGTLLGGVVYLLR